MSLPFSAMMASMTSLVSPSMFCKILFSLCFAPFTMLCTGLRPLCFRFTPGGKRYEKALFRDASIQICIPQQWAVYRYALINLFLTNTSMMFSKISPHAQRFSVLVKLHKVIGDLAVQRVQFLFGVVVRIGQLDPQLLFSSSRPLPERERRFS